MNFEGWMRTDIDFGVPWKTFVVSMRDLAAAGVWPKFKVLPDGDAAGAAALIAEYIVQKRPELTGCTVVAMRGSMGLSLSFDVMHTSFPAVLRHRCSPVESLETCAQCRQSLWVETQERVYRTDHGDFCSKDCADAKAKFTPTDGVTADMDGLTAADGRMQLGKAEQYSFIYDGLKCSEFRIPMSDGHTRLMWCLQSVNSLKVGGRINMLFHRDYAFDLLGTRRRIASEFAKYHNLKLEFCLDSLTSMQRVPLEVKWQPSMWGNDQLSLKFGEGLPLPIEHKDSTLAQQVTAFKSAVQQSLVASGMSAAAIQDAPDDEIEVTPTGEQVRIPKAADDCDPPIILDRSTE